MRVLLLFSSSQLGGAERSLSRMAFASEQVNYQLATLDSEGPWCDWIRSQGRFPMVFGVTSSGGTGMMFGALLRLINYVRNNPVDIIYVCGVRATFMLRFLRGFLPRIKLVHGVRWNPNTDNLTDRLFRLTEWLTYFMVDAWITNSVITRKTLVCRCRIPESKIFVIYNGLESLPEEIVPLNERPLEVLTVANLNPRKGHCEFLQIIRSVVKELPKVRFIFVGRDDMNGKVQRAIEEHGLFDFVRCEGFKADVSPWFRQARLFVLPSLWGEGCPTSILEAFSYGLPVIAYSADGIPELVADKEDGLLVKPGHLKEFENAIKKLLTSVLFAESMGLKGRKKVKNSFLIEQCATQHLSCFTEIVSKS